MSFLITFIFSKSHFKYPWFLVSSPKFCWSNEPEYPQIGIFSFNLFSLFKSLPFLILLICWVWISPSNAKSYSLNQDTLIPISLLLKNSLFSLITIPWYKAIFNLSVLGLGKSGNSSTWPDVSPAFNTSLIAITPSSILSISYVPVLFK